MSRHAGIGPSDGGRARATIHRVVPPSGSGTAAEELEQLLPYIGGRGSGPGRRFSIRSGVIGKAVRARGAVAAKRKSDEYEEFVEELVREWAYTEHDARKLSSDRRSWMAVPVFDSGTVVCAVVYLDSNQTDFFTPELQQIILNASGGIATFVDEVYR